MQSSDQRQQHERGQKAPGPIHPVICLLFTLFFFFFSSSPNVSHQRTSHPDTSACKSNRPRRRAPAPRLRPPGQQLPRGPQAIFQG